METLAPRRPPLFTLSVNQIGGFRRFVLLLMALSAAALGIGTPPAQAAGCAVDENERIITFVEDPGGPDYTTSSGTMADMWVPAGPTTCQRVSSIYVTTGLSRGFFEFGVILGYSACNGVTYTVPRLFYWATNSSGQRKCGILPGQLAERQYDTFRASDLNRNTVWGGWLNGVELQPDGVDLDFSAGFSSVARERQLVDNGFAKWTNLKEWHPTNSWTLWDDGTCLAESDPDYYCHKLSVSSVAADLS